MWMHVSSHQICFSLENLFFSLSVHTHTYTRTCAHTIYIGSFLLGEWTFCSRGLILVGRDHIIEPTIGFQHLFL